MDCITSSNYAIKRPLVKHGIQANYHRTSPSCFDSQVIMKIISTLLACVLVTSTASTSAEAPMAPTATLSFQLLEETRGPIVAHLFNGKPDKKCKGKGLISSISRGNPFVRTKNNEGVAVPASNAQKYLVILVPASTYLSCKWTLTFTPKANERYTIVGKYVHSGHDQRSCSVSVLEGDKPLAVDLLQIDEC